MMQEYVQRYFDKFLDRQEGDKKTDTPYIYTIPKGTLAMLRLSGNVKLHLQERQSRAT